MQAPDDIRKRAVFVCYRNPISQGMDFAGTAFFVGEEIKDTGQLLQGWNKSFLLKYESGMYHKWLSA